MAVRTHAHDLSGRPATEISRIDNPEGEVTSTFENPATGTVLESLFVTPANQARHVTASTDYDLCKSITSSNTLPANPLHALARHQRSLSLRGRGEAPRFRRADQPVVGSSSEPAAVVH